MCNVFHDCLKKKNKRGSLSENGSPYNYKVIEKLCPIWDFFRYSKSGHKHPKPIIRLLDYKPKENPSKRFLVAEDKFKELQDSYGKGKCSKEKLAPAEKKYLREFRRDFRYCPDLRTLLLYFYNEYHTKVKSKNENVSKVLSNPAIIDIAPFLKYWKDFQDYGLYMFNAFSDLFMKIGYESRNQLHIKTENDTYLIRRVTERIFIEVELYLGFVLDPPGKHFFIKENGIDKYNRLVEIRKKYRKSLIYIQRDWLEERRKSLDFYEQECESFDQQYP